MESLKEPEPLDLLVKKCKLTPVQISTWKSLALKNFGSVFSTDPPETREIGLVVQLLHAQIGQLKVEIDFLIKSFDDKF